VALAETPAPASGAIAAALQPFIDHQTMAGAVTIVATRDKILDVETIGYSDLATKKPMAPDSLFWIASMTKAMTCTALMMLVDEGKLGVDDPVEKYLPEFKDQMYIAEKDDDHVLLKRPAQPMTLRQLMSHTSGLPGKTPIDAPTFDYAPIALRMADYAATPLVCAPGTRFLYTNVGMTTVGRIVEVVSGLPYERFLHDRLFAPLGMNDTTFHPSPEQLQRLATTYKANAMSTGLEPVSIGMLNRDLADPARVAWPGGGAFSTAGDIAKFCQMFLLGGVAADGRRLLSEASVAAMTRKETGDAVREGYGFGWFMFPVGYFHAGADHTEMRIYPPSGLITVFMVQQSSEWPNGEGKEILPAFAHAAEKFAPATTTTRP
jgi:CubicO group peptidase (beta-lactamase class C family)